MEQDFCLQMAGRIRQLSRFLDKYSKYLNNKYQITLPQLLCLNEIAREDSINLTELTRRVNMNNSAVTGIIDRLELKCYLRRARKGTDRRTVQIEITEAGSEFTEKIKSILEEDCFFDLGKLQSGDLQEMMESMQKIINSFEPEVKKIELT